MEKLAFDQDSSGKDTSYIQNKRTNEKIWLRQENGVCVLDLMVALPQTSNDRSTDPHFSSAGIAFTTLVSPIETQLRKVIPELCVNAVPERVAEVEMSSSNPVRCDPLPDWLQPFDENLVDEEEQRVDRVEVFGNIQDDDQERGSCCTRRKSSTATSTQASQSTGGSGTRTDAHPLPQLVCTIVYEEQGDPMRIADEQDKVRKKENNT